MYVLEKRDFFPSQFPLSTGEYHEDWIIQKRPYQQYFCAVYRHDEFRLPKGFQRFRFSCRNLFIVLYEMDLEEEVAALEEENGQLRVKNVEFMHKTDQILATQ
ncbi:hypothetical protein SESBI_12816 [Sesbania bispinosa]|nr:hypothetical protein SESBI_12816 [Sesbania bispinosa]